MKIKTTIEVHYGHNSIIATIDHFVNPVFFLLAGCQFYPPGEYLRFVRVPENLKIGDEVLRVEVHPRNDLTLLPVDKVSLFNF